MKKSDLPQKVCPVCDRPFSWRKKWKKNWEELKYCSNACRKKKKATMPGRGGLRMLAP